jgi:hypothetical protein
MPLDLPRACQSCRLDAEGRITHLCPEGRSLHEVDTASPPGAQPQHYRNFALHVWGVGQPPLAALGAKIPGARPYAREHDSRAVERAHRAHLTRFERTRTSDDSSEKQ